MKGFQFFLCRHFLPKIVARKCPESIPRSGADGARINCFSVKLDRGGKPFFWVRSIIGNEVHGLEWNGSQFATERSLDIMEINPDDFFIIHYYGLVEVKYSGIVDLAVGRVTRLPYLKVNLAKGLRGLDQYFFNKKKLFTNQSIDLIQILLQRHFDNKPPVDSLDVMTDLYSSKWLLHPEGQAGHRRVKFFLDALVKSGELEVMDHRYYSVSPQALQKLEQYEEEERKHIENVKVQRGIFWLTLAIAFFSCVQAGLIKLPVLLDLSGYFSK